MIRSDEISQLHLIKKQAKEWLLEKAIPLWNEKGKQPCGLRAEKMDEHGQPDPSYFRVFVQARHIFSLAVAGRMGYQGPWRESICQIIEAVLKHGRRKDGFFVHKLDKGGQVSDPQTDLYDQAFMLLAFSECFWALGEERFIDDAQRLLEDLEDKWALPLVGFYEGDRGNVKFVHQNPHMHLLEAFISLYERSGRSCFYQAAQKILDMAQKYFVDEQSGGIIEDFHRDMKPCLYEGSYRMEPGHCYEWSWLYEQPLVGKILGNTVSVSDHLVGFARRYGIDAQRHIVMNEVLAHGDVCDERGRLWPQTERIKAASSRFSHAKQSDDLHEIIAGWRGLTHYFNPKQPGLWFDQMKKDGGFESNFSPASSLYHIACAIETLCNVKEQ